MVNVCISEYFMAGKVVATDDDIDMWNAEITYSIQFFNEKPLPFHIHSKSGSIWSSLTDLDTSATFLFAVVAQDRGKTFVFQFSWFCS